jgi:hypothetical protein
MKILIHGGKYSRSKLRGDEEKCFYGWFFDAMFYS